MTAGVFSIKMRNQFILAKVEYKVVVVRVFSTRGYSHMERTVEGRSDFGVRSQKVNSKSFCCTFKVLSQR